MATLGERLKALRQKNGWSQIYVSKKLHIPNTTLSGYERDYREPDLEILERIAELYEVSVGYLVAGYEDQLQNDSTKLNKEDLDFIEEYKSLNDEDKEYVLGLIRRIRKR